MTYEEYMKLLEEGDKRVREMGREARAKADALADIEADMMDEDIRWAEVEEEFVSETVASYMVYGGA